MTSPKEYFDRLKMRHRETRANFEPNFNLRIHRSLSWLKKAEMESSDADGGFIFYWIAFNAAYSDHGEKITSSGEREIYQTYFRQLIECDTRNEIYDVIWSTFPGPIRSLLNNHFTYEPFWRHYHGNLAFSDWNETFQVSLKLFGRSLEKNDTQTILELLFARLYFLRNQMLHGGATWNGSVNRGQVQDCRNILGSIVPTFIEIMMENPSLDWGDTFYPVIDRN